MKYIIIPVLVYIVLSSSVDQHLEQVANQVAANVDQNKDGILTITEIFNSLITRFDENGDGCAEKKEFVNKWSQYYHEDNKTSALFFDHLDMDLSGCLTKTDLRFNFAVMDSAHGDHSVTVSEFASFLHAVYPKPVVG